MSPASARRGAASRPLPKGAPKAGTAGPTPPRRRKPGKKLSEPKAILVTSFRAEGGIGRQLAEQIYGGFKVREGPRYARKAKRFAEIQSNHPAMYPDSPGIWVSNQGFILGQVNFPGRVSLDTLFNMLNKALNLNVRLVEKRVYYQEKGKRKFRVEMVRKVFRQPDDFRDVYQTWKYKYQVVEVLVVPQNRQARFKADNDGKIRRIVTVKSGNSRSG